MNNALLIVAAFFLVTTLAQAESVASQNEISALLVAEEVCGLTYDKEAVQALTRKNTNADDQASESVRGLMTVGGRAQYEKMSTAEKRAFCLHQTNVATRWGLIK